MKKICIINVVGLTSELVKHAPNIQKIGKAKTWKAPTPAVTCTSQATILTGKSPAEHGAVANGWLFRDTQEVRLWQQMYRLLERPAFYEGYKTLSMFWWYSLGAPIDYYVVPRPHYGCDGSKAFDVIDKTGLNLKKSFGNFPFHNFWGPMAGLGSSEWIAKASAYSIRKLKPEISLVYLPHLDYDYQRETPGNLERVKEVDQCAKIVIEAAADIDAQVIVLSEYGLTPVSQPIFLNKKLREKGWLKVRQGPFGDRLQPQESLVFAVVDHQVAHVYVNGIKLSEVQRELEDIPGVSRVCVPEELELDHSRSGELIVLSNSDSWFAYDYWLEAADEPDFHRTIDIHNKPGYDPCELFLGNKFHLAKRILQKKLGFRVAMDIINNDPYKIKGSHGLELESNHSAVIIGENTPDDMKDFYSFVKSILDQ